MIGEVENVDLLQSEDPAVLADKRNLWSGGWFSISILISGLILKFYYALILHVNLNV